MRHAFLIAVAAAAIAIPAAAQSQVTVDVPGVGVRIGPDRAPPHREGWRERDVRGDCKTVTVQERGPDGTMITRQKTNC